MREMCQPKGKKNQENLLFFSFLFFSCLHLNGQFNLKAICFQKKVLLQIQREVFTY